MENFTHFDETWKEVIKKARKQEFHVYEDKRKKHHLPLILEKEELKISVYCNERHVRIWVDAPFSWEKNTSFLTSTDDMIKEAQQQLLTLLETADSLTSISNIIKHVRQLKELNIEDVQQLNNLDLKKIEHELKKLKQSHIN